ncbi:MAG TPA: polysaccharide deacetylase family protein [Kineosporiaceae bacterium]|jgi:peptidoglycan/xylan/chitin deacetylase (PgdA/CDA1 family)|nr:polysaccharide deacetylase family protein [Kineosporiaceae bacterium]
MSGTSSKPRRVALIGLLAGGLLAGSLVAVLPAQGAARNLESNPSAETLSRGVPKGWSKGGSGTNNRALSVRTGGAQSGKRYVRSTITRYSSGGAWWVAPSVSARAGTYSFTDYYRSNAVTRIDVAITTRGRTVVKHLGNRRPASRWTASKVTVAVPSGTTRLSFRHVLASKGFLDVDSIVVAPAAKAAPGRNAPAKTKGLVSVTFDDGYTNQYDNAFPVLKKDGIPGTFYLISGYLDNPSYMTTAQAQALQVAGSELGSHTVNHPDLTTLAGSALTSQFADSKASLEKKFGPVTDLAYPYGASNGTVQQEAAKYYRSARSTNSGTNARGSLSKYALTIGYVLNTTSVDTIKGWIADAQAKDTWLILCYHGIADGKAGDTYTTNVSDFTATMAAIKSSGIKPVTVHDGLSLMGG